MATNPALIHYRRALAAVERAWAALAKIPSKQRDIHVINELAELGLHLSKKIAAIERTKKLRRKR